MMRGIKIAVAVLICLVWSVACGGPPEGVDYWFVDSLIKVFPSDNLRAASAGAKTAELWGARNQHVSLQVALRSAKLLTSVTGECEPLKGPSGATIQNIQLNPVGYVVVATHSEDTPAEELVGEAPGWYPDVLLDFPMELKANWTSSIWLTIPIPTDSPPGLYQGVLTVRSGQQELAQAPVRLNVVATQIPQDRTLKVTNWFTLADRHCRQFFDAPQFSPEWWTLIENVARVMGDHRQNVIITPIQDLTRAYIDGGRIRYDFSNFDRWVDTFRSKGGFKFIEGDHLLGRQGGSYDEPLQVSTFQLVKGKVQRLPLPVDDPLVEPALVGFLSALNKHLEEKNWKSIYLQHVLDEPHGTEPPYYARFAGVVRRCLPGIPTIDAIDAEDVATEVTQNSDIWVPQLGRFDSKVEMLQQRIQSGHEVWFYTCLFPRAHYMSRLIDFPLIKTRLLHWLNFQQNLTGFLHWGGNYWTPKPMMNTQPVINLNQEYLPPGDAFIVYPDKARRSLYSSIRLEAMREGIEDYELLKVLAQRNPQEAQHIVKQAITTFTDYVRDVPTFRKIQRGLLEEASK
jgi:hypothetical protein